jgi:hypothetical protein
MEKQAKDRTRRITQKCSNSPTGTEIGKEQLPATCCLRYPTFCSSQVSFAATTFPLACHQVFVLCVICDQLFSSGSFEGNKAFTLIFASNPGNLFLP